MVNDLDVKMIDPCTIAPRGHGLPFQRRSSRDIASCINSGSALKYQ
jgi:hypothetical protein